MRILLKRMLFVWMLCASSIVFAATGDDAAVATAYQNWCKAIGAAKGDAQQVVKYYAKDAILLPTLSAKILRNNASGGMIEYFTKLTGNTDMKCTPEKLITKVYDNEVAVNSGFYEFSYMDNGKLKKVPARFTFVYEKLDGKWMIVNHHSSMLP